MKRHLLAGDEQRKGGQGLQTQPNKRHSAVLSATGTAITSVTKIVPWNPTSSCFLFKPGTRCQAVHACRLSLRS